MQDKKIDERDIDRVEGNSEVKKYLKETWKKFRNKSQDEIADMLFSSIRTYGVPLIMLLANLVA